MADALFLKAKQHILNKEVDFDTDTLKLLLVSTTDPPVVSTDEFLLDIATTAHVATSSTALQTPTIANGVFDAADFAFLSIPTTAATIASMIIYQDTGLSSTSILLYYNDAASGLPYVPTGATITVSWDAAGIFSL